MPPAPDGRDGARDRGFRIRFPAPGCVRGNGQSAPRPYRPMIGAFSSAPAPARRVIVDPGFLPYRDRAAFRILYRADVATTAQLTVLAYARRQTAQERLSRLDRAGYLERVILPALLPRWGSLGFRVSPRGRRRLGYDPLTRSRAGTQLVHARDHRARHPSPSSIRLRGGLRSSPDQASGRGVRTGSLPRSASVIVRAERRDPIH